MFMFWIFKNGEHMDKGILMEWNMHKNLPLQKDVKHPTTNNHLGHTW
jgi:hypothetical protein